MRPLTSEAVMAQIRAGTCALNHSEKPEDFIKSRETGGFGKDASAAAASGASPPAPSGSSLAVGNVVPNRREGERQVVEADEAFW